MVFFRRGIAYQRLHKSFCEAFHGRLDKTLHECSPEYIVWFCFFQQTGWLSSRVCLFSGLSLFGSVYTYRKEEALQVCAAGCLPKRARSRCNQVKRQGKGFRRGGGRLSNSPGVALASKANGWLLGLDIVDVSLVYGLCAGWVNSHQKVDCCRCQRWAVVGLAAAAAWQRRP